MDKNTLKKYAVWARRELITRVSQRATFYGVTESGYGDVNAVSINGRVLSDAEKKQRQALIARIQKKGYEEVMEEVAYTWFNRFLALRFMEVNGYLPHRVKVFTDNDNRFKPQILTEAIDLELDGLDMEQVYAYKDANQTEELYKYLLVVQCNALNAVLPRMFQKIKDYTELLLPDKLLLEGSVIERMIALIPEEDWRDAVQIIGWMYQYYNSEKKDEVFAALKKNVKITKENIPAATQLFTPDWIVRYMVENSLGRLWLEGHPNEELKNNWKYYLEEAEQEPEVEAELAKIRAEYSQLTPEDIRCIDPCQGSGHILVYMFDVLMQIYESYGYTTQEAVAGIVMNNIYGLDIDERAAQLSYFAVMMKACQYDKRFLKRKDEEGNPKVPQPRVYVIQESNDVDSRVLEYFCNGDDELKEAMETIMEELYDAKEYGSIITVTQQNWDAIYARFEEIREDISMYKEDALELLSLVQVAQALAQKYDVVVTNPPYMGNKGMDAKLTKYVQKNYFVEKLDLFAVFVRVANNLVRSAGYQAMITQHSWMFLQSFNALRVNLLNENQVKNMAHLGSRAFDEIGGEVVQTATFVLLKKRILEYCGIYVRLVDVQGEKEKSEAFFEQGNKYVVENEKFIGVPNQPVAYWLGNNILSLFSNMKSLGEKYETKLGMSTNNNNRFLRFWYEVSDQKTCFVRENNDGVTYIQKWFPYSKGGSYRKWYGNVEYVINWLDDGAEVKQLAANLYGSYSRTCKNTQHFFKSALTWGLITPGAYSCRYLPAGCVLGDAGPVCFAENDTYLLLAYLNSCIVARILPAINPTINCSTGILSMVPLFDETKVNQYRKEIEMLSIRNINVSKEDWDESETSWGFKIHPLVGNYISLRNAYSAWENLCDRRFLQMKENERRINEIFLEIDDMKGELSPEIEDQYISVKKADVQRDVRSFISYAVGCMFGRYSLEKEGLIFAGGRMEDKFSYYGGTFADTQDYQLDGKYTFGELGSKFYYIPIEGKKALDCWKVDADNIIPITDDEYFEDDIVEKFIAFIRTVYGEKTLEENLKFIADTLGGKGHPREVIRNYFLNDFYKDHCKIYQKRPIYWLFDSGKKNGFKCLIYMHRYESDTIARIRTDYVHEQQSRYRTEIEDLEHRIANAETSERVKLNKSLKKLQEQADELHAYEEKIHHLADQMIAIDLDDGVKHNYEIFKDVLAKIK